MLVVKKNLEILIKQVMVCKVKYWLVKQLLKVLIRLTVGLQTTRNRVKNQTGESKDQTNNQDANI